MKPLLLLVAVAALHAQILQILPAPSSVEGVASFQILFVSSSSLPVVALQWKLLLPEGATAAPDDLVTGSAAEAAGKSLICSAAPLSKTVGGKRKSSVYACILAGGQKPLSSGAVALVKCNLHAGFEQAAVRLREVIGVSPDLKRTDLPDAEATVRAK
jgi:hypothetical protein